MMTGIWLEHCQACSAPEVASVINRSGINYHLVTSYLADEAAWTEIESWIATARVVAGMRKNRLGLYWITLTAACSTFTQT